MTTTVGNRLLTKYLSDALPFNVFSELLSVGAVRILRRNSKEYPSNLTRDPCSFPLGAHAEHKQRNRSYSGKAWRAKDWEWRLFSRLDEVLARSSDAHQLQQPFPEENEFAVELSKVLAKRVEYRLNERAAFKDIDPHMADRFTEFCREPEKWVTFLEKKGVEAVDAHQDGFYRAQAYQCTFPFEPKAQKAMQRLVESVYAACECEREHADGCYGRGGLAELPAECEVYDDAYREVSRLEPVPIVPNAGLELAIGPGIASVIAEVRSRNAFRDFQEHVAGIGSNTPAINEYSDPYETFSCLWNAVCGDYADAWRRYMVHPVPFDSALTRLVLVAYISAPIVAGFYIRGLSCDSADRAVRYSDIVNILKNMADVYYVVPRMQKWLPRLSQRIRGLVKMPSARAEMMSAATVRHTRVELHPQAK